MTCKCECECNKPPATNTIPPVARYTQTPAILPYTTSLVKPIATWKTTLLPC